MSVISKIAFPAFVTTGTLLSCLVGGIISIYKYPDWIESYFGAVVVVLIIIAVGLYLFLPDIDLEA